MAREWCCAECGSTNVQVSAWVDANTGKVLDGEGPASRPWCEDCCADRSLETRVKVSS